MEWESKWTSSTYLNWSLRGWLSRSVCRVGTDGSCVRCIGFPLLILSVNHLLFTSILRSSEAISLGFLSFGRRHRACCALLAIFRSESMPTSCTSLPARKAAFHILFKLTSSCVASRRGLTSGDSVIAEFNTPVVTKPAGGESGGLEIPLNLCTDVFKGVPTGSARFSALFRDSGSFALSSVSPGSTSVRSTSSLSGSSSLPGGSLTSISYK